MIKYTKLKLVTVILNELPENSPYHSLSHEEIQKCWFVTNRGDGLQLTNDGNKAFQDADIEYYDRPLNWPNILQSSLVIMTDVAKNKVELSRKITCPYYIFQDKKIVTENNKSVEKYYHYIRLYDERLTVWIDLRGGIEEYLKSVY